MGAWNEWFGRTKIADLKRKIESEGDAVRRRALQKLLEKEEVKLDHLVGSESK